ncbi:hypothetical protein [Streptoalloteichus hindustanus]|nr:hypothetical protein [Streptoalloteichus hindustanus]
MGFLSGGFADRAELGVRHRRRRTCVVVVGVLVKCGWVLLSAVDGRCP